jgi:outer membrane protein assembly factor BamE (lipoprotein component of BamABCDE complex)
MKRLIRALVALICAIALAACDQQGRPIEEIGLEKLTKGMSTESDVRMIMGQPGTVWEEENGTRSLEYPKGPEGHRTWFFDIGKDGKLKDYRQALTPENFAGIKPGMSMDAVRRILGKPRKETQFTLKKEVVWDWLYLERVDFPRLFHVHFDIATNKVMGTSSSDYLIN